MKAVIAFLKYHWQQRIFKFFTLFALADFYLLIFHYNAYTSFLSQMATSLAGNQTFIAIVVGLIGALFAWIKK